MKDKWFWLWVAVLIMILGGFFLIIADSWMNLLSFLVGVISTALFIILLAASEEEDEPHKYFR